MIDAITLEKGDYGTRAVIGAVWSGDMVKFLLDHGVVELELNDGKGWQGDDLWFLADLPQLRSFTIMDFKIASVEPIHFLHELRHLKVFTYCQTAISFSAFPRLEDCALEWRPKSTSLFDCMMLKKLFVNRYDGKNSDPFTRLLNLESLAILNARVQDLHGLSALKMLRSLRLGGLKRVTSLAGIDDLRNLEELDIDTCRGIRSIDEVRRLSRLRKLFINNVGDIESLKPLDNLDGLEWVLFEESTNIVDGDLSPLLRQNNLSRVNFRNRRHYSHRLEEFGAYGE